MHAGVLLSGVYSYSDTLFGVAMDNISTTRLCPACGTEKPRKAFHDRKRNVVFPCIECRRKAHRAKRRAATKRRKDKRVAATTVNKALSAMETKIASDKVTSVVNALRAKSRMHRAKAAEYARRLRTGEASSRTDLAADFQTRKADFLDEVRDLFLKDAEQGRESPLEAYTTDERLLKKHGLITDPKETDPS